MAANKNNQQQDINKSEAVKNILKIFESISAVPRKSKHEEKIRAYLIDWAKKQKFEHKTDEAGNVLICIPGKNGSEKSAPVILQGHMDMVCEKTPDSNHDFSKDPIELVYEGEWLKANKTTLGADNGIAIAIAMAIAENKSLKHPPLELLFTVDEETGLTGAQNLKPGFLKGKTLINIDSEDEGVFTVGCAGGKDTHIALDLQYEEVPSDYKAAIIKASGMTGGHSGVNIHEERANAIRVLVRTLHILRERGDLRLVSINGGTAHNAIPRDASASFYVSDKTLKETQKLFPELEKMFQNEFKKTDPELKLTLEIFETPPDRRGMMSYFTSKVLDFLFAMPHGVTTRDASMPELVETSNNQAKVWIKKGKLCVETSQRSSVMSRLEALTKKIEAIARLSGARVLSDNGYPAWQPDFDSKLLAKCQKIYKDLFKKDAKVEAIHAGLECGLIGSIEPEMEMISLGPTIKNPHSPDEKINIPSIEKIWLFVIELLKSF